METLRVVSKKRDAALLYAQQPARIILLRHGESEGNVDHTIYSRKPDNQVELTPNGVLQAKEAGKQLSELLGPSGTVRFFVSPYKRSYQTLEGILSTCGLTPDRYTVREEPRIREQDWGNFQDPQSVKVCMEERQRFGSFYYRLPNGESGADVFSRVTSFWSTIHREFKYEHCLENFVLISHGITCRLLLMRYFKWTVEEFHKLWNLENCQIVIMALQPDGKYKLVTPLKRNP